jgi:hypothetical protein
MIDVDDEFTGIVIEKLSARKAELKDMGPSGAGKTRISLVAPSRSLIGYQGEFLTDTRGSGVLNRVFSHYEPHKGAIDQQRKGVLISNSDGETAAYALWNLEERGTMFVGPNEKTYQGMIIGENARLDDLDVNPMKAKQLTNVRASGKDEAIRLTPPRRMTLEQAIAYIDDDELVEVTPKNIRLRKQTLNPSLIEDHSRSPVAPHPEAPAFAGLEEPALGWAAPAAQPGGRRGGGARPSRLTSRSHLRIRGAGGRHRSMFIRPDIRVGPSRSYRPRYMSNQALMRSFRSLTFWGLRMPWPSPA